MVLIDITQSEFLASEIKTWGFDYIESLLERGFEPKLTTKGWTWILPVRIPTNSLVLAA